MTTDIGWQLAEEPSAFDCLKADCNITQGAQSLQSYLPLPASISWAQGHQGGHRDWEGLSPAAKGNCHADNACAAAHLMSASDAGLFPKWAPEPQQRCSTMGSSSPNG